MSDPLRIVWDALAAKGFGPHGQPHNFRSICSGHPGADNRSALHVWDEGGEAKMCCFTHGCDRLDIIEPLGLRLRDLYPVDPGDSGRRLRTARREDFSGNARALANVLLALERLGLRWGGALWLDECPNCEWPWAQLTINSKGEPKVHCQRGCDVRMVEQALADRLTDPRRRAA